MTIFVGSEGVKLPISVMSNGKALDLSGATVDLTLKNPSTKTTKTNISITDAAKGQCVYTLTKTDLNVAGQYQVQPIIKYADGREFPGSVSAFPVTERL